MQAYFVDTWYLIALADPFDRHHAAAMRLERYVGSSGLLTHDGVMLELLASFAADGARARAAAATTVRLYMSRYEVIPADRERFLRALALYERRPDKEYSLVDCMSMELMRMRGVSRVLTNDHHFRQEGFTVLSDAP